MREIKFRALAVVNDKHNNIKVGDFVYGHYIESGCDAPCIIFGDGEQIEIDKKTLGQCINLKTRRLLLPLYDGDIVSVTGDGEYLFNHEIKYDNNGGCYPIEIGGMDFDNTTMHWAVDMGHYEYTLIGNAHQNPGLLCAKK